MKMKNAARVKDIEIKQLHALRSAIAQSMDVQKIEELAEGGAFRIHLADALGQGSFKGIFDHVVGEYPQMAVFSAIENSKTCLPNPDLPGVMARVLKDFFADQDQIEYDLHGGPLNRGDPEALRLAVRHRFEATLSVWVAVCAKWTILSLIEEIAKRMGGLSFLENEKLWVGGFTTGTQLPSFKVCHPAFLAVQDNSHEAIGMMLKLGWDPQKAYHRAPPEDGSGDYVRTYPWQFKGLTPIFNRPDSAGKAMLLQHITEQSLRDGEIQYSPEISCALMRWVIELIEMPESMRHDPTNAAQLAVKPDPETEPGQMLFGGEFKGDLGLSLAHGIHLLDPEECFMRAVANGVYDLALTFEAVVDWSLFGAHLSPLAALLDNAASTLLTESYAQWVCRMVIRNGRGDLMVQPFDTPWKSPFKKYEGRTKMVSEVDRANPRRPKTFDYPLSAFVRMGFRRCAHDCLVAGANPDFKGDPFTPSPRSSAKSRANQTLETILSFEAGRKAQEAIREIGEVKSNTSIQRRA